MTTEKPHQDDVTTKLLPVIRLTDDQITEEPHFEKLDDGTWKGRQRCKDGSLVKSHGTTKTQCKENHAIIMLDAEENPL